jgi:hypothetical protein
MLTKTIKWLIEQLKIEIILTRILDDFIKKSDLEKMEKKIMSKITDIESAQKAYFDEMGVIVDNIASDVKLLNDKLTAIQNSPGTLSPEDQASLDSGLGLVKGLRDRLKTLDDMTPPDASIPPVTAPATPSNIPRV